MDLGSRGGWVDTAPLYMHDWVSPCVPMQGHEIVQHEAGPPPGGPGALPERISAQAHRLERCICVIKLHDEGQIHPIFDEPTAPEFPRNARAPAVPRVAGVARVAGVPSI